MSEAGGLAHYRLVLFDLDLTLFDFEASEQLAYAETLRRVGAAEQADSTFDRYKQINATVWSAVERGELTPAQAGRERFETLCSELTICGADPDEMSELFQTGLGRFGDLYPDAPPVLDALSTTRRLGIVTNGITEVQHAKVERLGLRRWFDPIIISGEVGVAKPDPAIFDLALIDHADVERSAIAMVGDSLTSDMAGANAAGIDAWWFNPHGLPLPEGAPAVTAEVRRLDELLGNRP